jgi:CcmD family protein
MPYLAGALIGVWLLVTIYVIFMSRRQSHLEEELRSLEEVLTTRKSQR